MSILDMALLCFGDGSSEDLGNDNPETQRGTTIIL